MFSFSIYSLKELSHILLLYLNLSDSRFWELGVYTLTIIKLLYSTAVTRPSKSISGGFSNFDHNDPTSYNDMLDATVEQLENQVMDFTIATSIHAGGSASQPQPCAYR